MSLVPAVAAGGASLAVGCGISAALTPIVRRWATKRGFVDHPLGPDSHKAHDRAVAFGGGVAITAAVVLPMLMALVAAAMLRESATAAAYPSAGAWSDWPAWAGGALEKTPAALAMIAGAIVLHLVGLVDDRRPLSPGIKFAVQIAVALTLTAGFGIRAGEALGTAPAIILTALWIVTLTNAFNFLDHADGLAAGVAAVTAAILAISSILAGQIFVPCMLLLTAGAAGGFLLYNFPPASIFMGDAGSMVLGYLLAVCTVLTTFYDPERGRTPFGVLVPLVVFAIPLYDMISVIVQRRRLGVSIFRGDRRHFSHRLFGRGMSPRLAVLTIYLATVATALPAILLPLHGWLVAMLILAQCLAVVAIIAVLEFRTQD